MRVRQAEIAARAGVSEATVSRVLNGRPGVAAATRSMVLAALDVSGYTYPAFANRRHPGLVGLIVPELSNPVFPLFADAVGAALLVDGYAHILGTLTAGGVQEDDYVSLMRERGVAGIIFVSGIHAVAATHAERYARLRESGIPIVLVNGYLPNVDAPFLSNDDATAVDLAVQHLAERGHRSIGLAAGPARYTTVIRRISGFHAAIRRHLPDDVVREDLDSLIETTSFTLEGGAVAAHALLAHGVTAIVCASDVMALGAIRAARDRGLRVPEDVSVVGSDDGMYLEFTDPPLTTIRQPVTEIASAAVQALVQEIEGRPAPRAEYLFRPELIVRRSTAEAPARPVATHPAVSKAEV